jgi:putative nucleotidyltransferase with HDIG domain
VAPSPALALVEPRSPAPAPRHRLLSAFGALDQLPALEHSRRTLLDLIDADRPSPGDIAATIESDAALAIAVLRAAGRAGERARNVPAAVHALPPHTLRAAVEDVPVFDFFDRSSLLAAEAGRLRVHALATQQAAQRICEARRSGVSGLIAVAALLHDVGKTVLAHAYDNHGARLEPSATPEERLRRERQTLGLDHAMAGGVLLRRIGLHADLSAIVEHHHAPEAEGDTAVVRLADMVAHYATGRPIDARELSRAAAAAELTPDGLRNVLARPSATSSAPRTELVPSPLSPRQRDILHGLREGKPYKVIADDLGISQSTIRTHLHHLYRKVGVIDRAQAVLLAAERGWL